uniref:N-acetyltransferase domain-containing protein n=1 Tax=Angiostrongylus cantonensis TaxID=6313 RepID=A0A0K0D537_ANGCA
LPKLVGDPWRGAYSKHGFWYKFHEGDKTDFDKLAALSFEQDKYMMNYDYMKVWKKSYGEGNVRILVAKNLKNDVIGGVLAIKKKDYTQIGTYFVKEEYRHSGIGSKLFREISKGVIAAFQAMHHLLPTVPSFGLTARYGRRLNHVKLDCASGFPDLKESLEDYRAVLDEDLSESEWSAVMTFDADVSGEKRPIRDMVNLEESKTAAVFNSKVKFVNRLH